MQITPPRLPNGQYAWWLIGDTSIRTLPAHANCNHRKYRLTCAQYEALTARAGGRCESCEKGGHLISKRRNKGPLAGRLHLDHDHSLGIWAVRGLLCAPCNTSIDGPDSAPLLAAYDARAFYRSVLDDHGLTTPSPPEPSIGAVIFDFAFRRWTRTGDGWQALHNYGHNRPSLVAWSALVADSGPHHLRLAADAA